MAHKNSKLTDREVSEIRNLLAQKVSGRSIAKRFGVSAATICLINVGKNWASAPIATKQRLKENISINPAGCWEWTGTVGNHGYGQLSVGNKHELAHRLSYREFKGEIPAGQCICHICDNRRCINPDHFFLGTRGENIKDAVAKDRHNRGERNRAAKLTDGLVLAIRKLADSGKYEDKEVATFFDVSRATITLIRQRKTWRHLEGASHGKHQHDLYFFERDDGRCDPN